MIEFEWTLVEDDAGIWVALDSNGNYLNWNRNFFTLVHWTVEWYNTQLDFSPEERNRFRRYSA